MSNTRMLVTDWVRLDAAQGRIADAIFNGYEPDAEDLDIVAGYR